MKNYTKYIIGFVALSLMVFVGAFVRYTPLQKGVAQSLVFYQAATNGAVSCANGSSTLLLASSTGSRTYIRISNLSSNSMFIGLGIPAATSSGVYMSGSSTFTIGDNQVVYAGPVYCLTQGGTATATILTIP